LTSDHGLLTDPKASASPAGDLRHPGDGLILARFDNRSSSLEDPQGDSEKEAWLCEQLCGMARLPLSGGTPSALSAHPGGEWMVIGHHRIAGMLATKHIELACRIDGEILLTMRVCDAVISNCTQANLDNIEYYQCSSRIVTVKSDKPNASLN